MCQAKGVIDFHNTTTSGVYLRVEPGCMPVGFLEDKFDLLRGKDKLTLNYNESVVNCIVLVPVEQEIGSEMTLFTFNANPSSAGFTKPQSCVVYVTQLEAGRYFSLTSDCLSLTPVL